MRFSHLCPMKVEELILIENQIFTQLLLEEFKAQRKAGAKDPADFLIDKYKIENLTKERLKQFLEQQ